MRFQRKIWSVRAMGFQIWDQTHLSVMHQSQGKGMSFGTSTITTVFNGGKNETSQGERSNKDTCGTSGDVTSMYTEGRLKDALLLLDRMEQRGFWAYSDTCARLLQGYAKKNALADGKAVHAHVVKSGFESNIFLGNTIVSMYCKCGDVVDARKMFNKMPKRNVISWTVMIAGLAKQGHGEEALELYWQMQREGVKADKAAFLTILNACASPANLEQGKRIHAGIIQAGLEADVQVGTAVFSMYCKCGNVVDAQRVFAKLPKRNVISWTAMIAGLAAQGHGEEAFDLFGKMQQEGMRADPVTFMSILNACASPGALERGTQLHADIIKSGFESDIRVGNALVSMYCRCGSVVDARGVFDKMPKRDVISWNAMMAGLAQQGHSEEASKFFRQMQREGVKPNQVSFIAILNACGCLAALEAGKWVNALIITSGLESDVRVCNALIDMYAKCGSMEDASLVFNKISNRNVVSWTALIVGYAQHGRGKEALQLFEQMQREGVKPNEVTFTGILLACSYVGLVDEGHHYFLSMSQDHGLMPRRMHYGCMVNLLGRAGRLEEAKDIINKMPFEPDASVLGALLGACGIHGHVELAERAAERILELEPDDDAAYVLLSDIYAAAGRWDDIAKVRKA